MKKILLIGCIILFVCCAPRKKTVQTEGLEEVVVFGEEEAVNISEEPVLPQPTEEEVVAPPPAEEEPAMPPAEEEEIVLPPPLPPEEPTEAPAEEEIAILPPPLPVEEPAPPVIEEAPMEEAPTIIEAPPVAVEEPPAVVEEPYVPPTVAPAPTPPPAAPSPPKILGFRVQLFASSTEKSASRVANDARTSFTEDVYVEYVAPYHKVRIGNCLTREEAEVLKNKARRLGYRGAFVVETMITP